MRPRSAAALRSVKAPLPWERYGHRQGQMARPCMPQIRAGAQQTPSSLPEQTAHTGSPRARGPAPPGSISARLLQPLEPFCVALGVVLEQVCLAEVDCLPPPTRTLQVRESYVSDASKGIGSSHKPGQATLTSQGGMMTRRNWLPFGKAMGVITASLDW